MINFTPNQMQKLREDMRLNQREFGEVIGISTTLIAAIENNNRPISKMTNARLNRLAQHLDVVIGEEWTTYLRCNAEINRMMVEGIPPLSFI